MFGEYNELINIKYTKEEAEVAECITEYVKKTYHAEVYVCWFLYDEEGYLHRLYIYLKTNDEKFSINRTNNKWKTCFPEDAEAYREFFIKSKIRITASRLQTLKEGSVFRYPSFEQEALLHTYNSSFSEKKEFFKKIYNPKTMLQIDSGALFVTYKSKELLEQAIASGETERFKSELYDIVKKHDVHGYVTYENLFVRFDSVETMLTQKEYYDLYSDMASGIAFQDFYKIK